MPQLPLVITFWQSKSCELMPEPLTEIPDRLLPLGDKGSQIVVVFFWRDLFSVSMGIKPKLFLYSRNILRSKRDPF